MEGAMEGAIEGTLADQSTRGFIQRERTQAWTELASSESRQDGAIQTFLGGPATLCGR